MTVVITFFLSNASAAWDFTPSITLGAIYTDNVTLDRGRDKEDDLLGEITPAFRLQKEKGRFTTDINYKLQNVFSSDDSDRSESFHNLLATAQSEILRDKFFIKLDATHTQQITDGQDVPDEANTFDIDNRDDQFTFNVNPFLMHDLGNFMQIFLSYEYGEVNYDDDGDDQGVVDTDIEDNTRSFYEARLSSFPNRSRLDWELFYERDRTETDDTDLVDKFERYGARLDYDLSSSFTLIGIAGDENNSFERELTDDTPEGSFWKAGFSFLPNKKHFLEVLYGDRDFGETWDVTWTRNTPKTTVELEYTEDITNETRDILGDGAIPTFDTPDRDLRLTQQVFEQKRFDSSFILRTAKSVYTLSLFSEERDFEIDEDEEQMGASFAWLWRIASKSEFEWNMSFTDTDEGQRIGAGGGEEDEEFYSYSATIRHKFTPRATGVVSARHNRLDSDFNPEDYDENSLRVGATFTF